METGVLWGAYQFSFIGSWFRRKRCLRMPFGSSVAVHQHFPGKQHTVISPCCNRRPHTQHPVGHRALASYTESMFDGENYPRERLNGALSDSLTLSKVNVLTYHFRFDL